METIDSIQEIELTCYENDENVLPLLKRNLEYCKEETKKKITVNIIEDNYILSQYLDFNHMLGGNAEPKKYDFVIGNPPYMKIPFISFQDHGHQGRILNVSGNIF